MRVDESIILVVALDYLGKNGKYVLILVLSLECKFRWIDTTVVKMKRDHAGKNHSVKNSAVAGGNSAIPVHLHRFVWTVGGALYERNCEAKGLPKRSFNSEIYSIVTITNNNCMGQSCNTSKNTYVTTE